MLALRDILVPVDFEPTSYHALAHARDLARAFGARLHVLHILEDAFALPAGTEGSLSRFPRLKREVEDETHDRLNDLLTDEDRQSGANAVALIAASPAVAIVGYATEIRADLIVMGTHGRTGKPLGVIGSVAEQVVRTAQCPVLTFRQVHSEGRVSSEPALETRRPATGTRSH